MTSFLTNLTKRKKTPEQLVTSACTSLKTLLGLDSATSSETAELRALADDNLSKNLGQMKSILYGDGQHVDVDEDRAKDLSRWIQSEGLLILLITHIYVIPFEVRKDTALLFNNLMRKNVSDFVGYVHTHLSLIEKLTEAYNNTETALICGSMLRECIRYDKLARIMLNADYLWQFFDKYVHLPNFEVASDAFNTLRDLLVTSTVCIIARIARIGNNDNSDNNHVIYDFVCTFIFIYMYYIYIIYTNIYNTLFHIYHQKPRTRLSSFLLPILYTIYTIYYIHYI